MVIQFSIMARRYGSSPFRFQNMWCKHDSFLSFVKGVWGQPSHGSGLVKLAAKIERTKLELRNWNEMVFGRVDLNIKRLEDRLLELEI